MKSGEMPRVKICCIQSVEEAFLALAHGADAIGLVSAMPSGPGPIPEERIAEIASALPDAVKPWLLTSLTDPLKIASQQRRCLCGVVQMVAAIEPRTYPVLREELPGVDLVQVVHVTGESAIDRARGYAELADGLLLDTGRPDAPIEELGGTGRTHDWSISRRIAEEVEVPVMLAGGLNPANVAAAIAAVRPAGVDVCSGLRTDGELDIARLAAFMEAVRASGT